MEEEEYEFEVEADNDDSMMQSESENDEMDQVEAEEDPLLGQVDEELANDILTPHEQSVHAVAIFQGRLITGSEDDTVKVDNDLLYQHKDTVISVQVSKDGKYLAVASMDGTVSIFDSACQLMHLIEGPGECSWIEWHPTTHFLAIGTEEGTVWVVEAVHNRCMVVMGGGRPLREGKWTTDGRQVVTGDEAGRVTVWSPKQGTAGLIYDQQSEVCSLHVLGNDLIMAGYANGEVRLLHTQHSMNMLILTLSDSIELICSAGNFAVIGSLAGELIVIDLNLMKQRGETLKLPAGCSHAHSWIGEYLVIGSVEGHLITIHPRTMEHVSIDLNHGIPCLSLTTASDLIWTGWDDGKVISINYAELLREE